MLSFPKQEVIENDKIMTMIEIIIGNFRFR